MTLLHPALTRLLGLRLRAWVRTTRNSLRSPRKAAFFVIGIVMMAFWLVPSLFRALEGERADPQIAHAFAPMGFLAMWAMSLLSNFGDYVIFFSPSEVNFLFTGPFTRRQLLLYKLATACIGMVFTTLVFSVVTLRGITYWAAGFVGIFLGLWFIHLLNMLVFLASQSIANRAYTRVRKVLLIALVALLAAAAWRGLGDRDSVGAVAALQHIAGHPLLKCATLPFAVFGNTVTATTLFPGMAGWAALGLLVDVAMIVIVFALDADYLETAADASRKRYARLQRVRRGGVFAASEATSPRRRWRRPFRAWGAGPVAWKQLITTARGSRGLLVMLTIVGFSVGIGMSAASPRGGAGASVGPFIGIVAWLCVFLPGIIRFDFRTDLASMESLKTLPVSPLAVAVGEIAVPVAVVSALELVLMTGATFMAGPHATFIAAAAFLVPLNTLLFALENFFFLLWPTAAAAASPGDFQFMGRQMVTIVVRFIMLGLACGFAALLGYIGTAIAGGNLIIGLATAWVCLTAEAAVAIRCVAWAYDRFDVSAGPPMD